MSESWRWRLYGKGKERLRDRIWRLIVAYKDGCIENKILRCAVVQQFDQMCRQLWVVGVLYEIWGFVVSY